MTFMNLNLTAIAIVTALLAIDLAYGVYSCRRQNPKLLTSVQLFSIPRIQLLFTAWSALTTFALVGWFTNLPTAAVAAALYAPHYVTVRVLCAKMQRRCHNTRYKLVLEV